jgi:hypothetical protein
MGPFNQNLGRYHVETGFEAGWKRGKGMDRRDFLIASAASGGLLLSRLSAWSETGEEYRPPAIFPEYLPPKRLWVARLEDVSLSERNLFTCLQGLVNRKQPRIYYLTEEIDDLYLKYYEKKYGITHEIVADRNDLLARFADELDGYIVYDPENPDTRNLATALGGIRNALPIHPKQVSRLKELGLSEIDDLRGRWKDRYEAYRWAMEKHFSECNQRILGMNCVDEPHWPSRSSWQEDYIVAGNIFTFDLSASRRDRVDRELLKEIFSMVETPACLMGWRSARNNEHELVGLAARHGIFVLCSISVPNLTVHTAIPKRSEPFSQPHVGEEDVGPVEKKVYISFMNTDGDSLSSMLHLQTGRFLEPDHGKIPYSWGFLPLAYDLLPGIAEYNFDLKLPNDYFAASTCGAAYAYPYLLPDTREYLRYSRHYMDKCGLRTAYMSNWDDDFWWQEMEVPGFLETMREELPDTIGFVRGMGESPFEPHIIDGRNAPYIYCGEGVHRDSKIYETLAEFIDANEIRPLFVYCLNNHTRTLKEMMEGVERLPKDEIEYVTLDKFFHLVNKAYREGLITDDLYPDKEGLKKILVKEAADAAPKMFQSIIDHGDRADLSEEEFRDQAEDPMLRLILDRSATPVSDIVAHEAVWDSMRLVRLSLNLKGIYVNNKAKGVKGFSATFGHLPEAGVVEELWKVWEEWEEKPVSYGVGSEFAGRVAKLAEVLQSELRIPEPTEDR